MSKITESALDKDCTIRIPGICNFDTATTVHCHLPGGGIGAKQEDEAGARGCGACHDEVDGRTRKIEDRDMVELWFYHAVIRTILQLKAEGLLGAGR